MVVRRRPVIIFDVRDSQRKKGTSEFGVSTFNITLIFNFQYSKFNIQYSVYEFLMCLDLKMMKMGDKAGVGSESGCEYWTYKDLDAAIVGSESGCEYWYWIC